MQDTFTMLNRFLKKIPLFLAVLYVFSACNQTPQAQSAMPTIPRYSTTVFPSTKPITITVQETPADVWDVSDIDISTVNPDKKLLSFTFDDAVGKTLESLLAVFASFNETHPDAPAYATLFCNGAYIHNENLHTLTAASAIGWELGNHAFSHTDLTTLPLEAQIEEIRQTDEILQRVDGKKTHLFRAPYGKIEKSSREILQIPVISWNVDTLDWAKKTEEEIYQTVMWKSYEGSIVLMHDGPTNTVEAVKRLLVDLYDAGFQVVSVSMLAKAHNCTLKNGNQYIRLRKNGTA